MLIGGHGGQQTLLLVDRQMLEALLLNDPATVSNVLSATGLGSWTYYRLGTGQVASLRPSFFPGFTISMLCLRTTVGDLLHTLRYLFRSGTRTQFAAYLPHSRRQVGIRLATTTDSRAVQAPARSLATRARTHGHCRGTRTARKVGGNRTGFQTHPADIPELVDRMDPFKFPCVQNGEVDWPCVRAFEPIPFDVGACL